MVGLTRGEVAGGRRPVGHREDERPAGRALDWDGTGREGRFFGPAGQPMGRSDQLVVEPAGGGLGGGNDTGG